jgi:ATP-binding cassette subfamily F protein 3
VQGVREIGEGADIACAGGLHGRGFQVGVDHEGHVGDLAELEELQQTGTTKSEMELRSILGCFLFSNDDVFKKIKVLSGGEKSRVALAKTLISEANFLLLDEPTNHLDFQSVNILIQALQQYEGTFITVSHDRHFIKGVANKIWYIENHEIKEYPGTYDEYEYWRRNNPQQLPPPVKAKEEKEKKPATSSTQGAPSEVALKKLNQELKTLEERIEVLEKEKAALEETLGGPEIYESPDRLKQVQEKLEAVAREMDDKNHRWEELVDEIEETQPKA